MRDWLESLQPREKVFVGTAAIVVALAVFWLAIWSPLDRGQESAAANVALWQDAVAELRSLQDDLRANAADRSTPAPLDQSLVVIVDETLRSRDLYNALQRSTPRNNGITLEFENAAFDDLVLWLGDLAEQYGLRVQNVGLNPAGDAAGRVSGTITLER